MSFLCVLGSLWSPVPQSSANLGDAVKTFVDVTRVSLLEEGSGGWGGGALADPGRLPARHPKA